MPLLTALAHTIALLLLPLTSPAQEKIYIESLSSPGLFWTVDQDRDSAVYLTAIEAIHDPTTATFLKKPNISRLLAPRPMQLILSLLPPNTIISFESASRPNHFLRHFSGRLRLDPYAENDLYAGDASFKIRPALDPSANAFSFESVNLPRSFLKQDKDNGIILAPYDPFDPEIDRTLYSFLIHTSLPSSPTTAPQTHDIPPVNNTPPAQ
ncbi:MAG: AbfB domain-containing protein [Methylacidiphilales bacterium]|nr:AbfB domain-containing protein [Candidatus Methylacidiphilales bacterium]MDW8349759.1 AbfB domain-containing protein [Verrucomicrobiae bacterium]